MVSLNPRNVLLLSMLPFLLAGQPTKEEIGQVVLSMAFVEAAIQNVCWVMDYKGEKERDVCRGQLRSKRRQMWDNIRHYAKETYPVAKAAIEKYHDACGDKYFLSTSPDPYVKPVVEETKVLHDDGHEYAWKAYAHCLICTVREMHGDDTIVKLLEWDKAGRNDKPKMMRSDDVNWQNMKLGLRTGMEMLRRTYYALCWYKDMKRLPYGDNTLDPGNPCHHHAAAIDRVEIGKDIRDVFSIKYYITSTVKVNLPKFHSKCERFLSDPKQKPETDESDALNDKRVEYPYKAYWYCVLNTFRTMYGDGAIQDVKNEVTHSTKSFVQSFLDRENEFRKRHGSDPMKLDQTLVKDAQSWAEQMAKECRLYKSEQSQRSKSTKGPTGENCCARYGLNASSSEPAYFCANRMYREIQFYPFPEGRDEADESYEHFTQTVWKGVKAVGYGVAENKNCGKGQPTVYTAARYFPVGNVAGQFGKNVIQPKDYNPADYYMNVSIDRLDLNEKAKLPLKMFKNVFYTMCKYNDKKDFSECVMCSRFIFLNPSLMWRVGTNQDTYQLGSMIRGHSNKAVPHYHAMCQDLLMRDNAPPTDDESAVLHDKSEEYPFKAYWHCMIHNLRRSKGAKVMEVIGDRMRTRNEHWTKTILLRINKFRAKKGLKPLEIKDKLNKDAQSKAQAMARKCANYGRSKRALGDNDEGGDADADGSNKLGCSSAAADPTFLAYTCVNKWHEGGAYRKQILSKTTTHIGFGEAIKPKCAPYPVQHIVVAFFPGVNRDQTPVIEEGGDVKQPARKDDSMAGEEDGNEGGGLSG